MPSCWEEAVSAMWIGLTGNYRLTYEDKAMEAEDQLERLLGQLDRREEKLVGARDKVMEEARQLRGGKDRMRYRAKVMLCKQMQSQLERLQSYKDTVGQHMDALRNTELNKSLITTLQESSKTLKAMGIVDGVRQAEAVIGDVQESMANVQELTRCLGTPMSVDIATDADLDRELDMLLEESGQQQQPAERVEVSAPLHSRSMRTEQAVAE